MTLRIKPGSGVEKEEIIISHFNNPNSFYYRLAEKDDELDLLDDVVEADAKNGKQDKKYLVGQKVIVEFLPMKKFLRAVVDDIKDNYILWALDYGFPISTSSKHLYQMNNALQAFEGSYVNFGGISNIIPAREIFDYSKGIANIIGEKSWNEIAMNVMSTFLKSSHKIWLLKDRLLSLGERYQTLCDLELGQPNNNTVSFKKYLLDKMFAIEVPEQQFELTLKRIRTNAIVRWKNFALVECCQRNDIPIPTKASLEQMFDDPEREVIPVQTEYDDDDESIELNEKISDWNFRNEKEKRKEKQVVISTEQSPDPFIDEIAFDDSVSCAPISGSGFKTSSWIRKTRSIADVRKKYGDIIPPPPSSKEDYFGDVASNIKPVNSGKPPSEISMRARHMEIFRKLQEKEKQEQLEASNVTKSALLESQEKHFQEAMLNARKQDDQLWYSGTQNASKQIKTKVSLPAGFDLANLKIGTKKQVSQQKSTPIHYYQGSNTASKSSSNSKSHQVKNPINLDFQNGGKIENTTINHLQLSSSSEIPVNNTKGDESLSGASDSSSTKLSTAQKIALKARNARINSSFLSNSSSENPLMKSLGRQGVSGDNESLSSSYLGRLAATSKSLRTKEVKSENNVDKTESVEHKSASTLVEHKRKTSIQKIMEMKAALLLSSSPDVKQNSPRPEIEQVMKPMENMIISSRCELDQALKPVNNMTNLEKIMQMKADVLLLNKTTHTSKSNNSQISKIESLRNSILKTKIPSETVRSVDHQPIISITKPDQSPAILLNSQNQETTKDLIITPPKSSSSQISKLESIKDSILSRFKRNENAFPSEALETGLVSSMSNKNDKNHLVESHSNNLVEEPSEVQNIANQVKLALKGNSLEEFLSSNSTNLLRQNTFEKFREAAVSLPMEQNLVMVHGRYIIPPVNDIKNVGFMNELIRELKDYNRLRRIQSYTWPSIIRGQSMIIINGEKTGKTMGYLPIICNHVANEYSKGIISDKYGPIACVIVPTSAEVEQITKLANKFLRRCEDPIPVVGMFGVRDEKDCMIQLLQLCGIFVGTPSCYRTLLKSDISFFDPKRIKIAVIDEVEINSDLETDIIRKLVPIKNNSDFQLVIVSRKWQKYFVKYLNAFESMVLCIGHYLEAAVYAKSHFRIELRETHDKIEAVLKYVHKYYYEYTKFIVVCNDDEEISGLMKSLNRSAYNSLIISSQASSEDLKVVKDWMATEEKNAPILICSDTELRQLNISNAEILIHFSLPSSWSKFCFRFSTQLGFYEDQVKLNFDVKNINMKPARTLILLDEENNTQLPKLIKFMDSHGYAGRIAPEVIEVAKQTKIQTEMSRSKEMRLFCDKAMEFGDCLSDQCKKRHLFTKLDMPYKGIPTHGLIKIEILNVASVTHYFARLLEFNVNPQDLSDPNSWKVLRSSNEFSMFSVRLSLFYSNPANLNNEWPLELKKMCTYMDIDTFHRCVILEHPPGLNEYVMKSVKCVIKLIDTGEIRVVKSVDILKLPKEFEIFPPQAVEIRLNGIVPHHGERSWDKKANLSVKKWLSEGVNFETDFICAKINFALMDTIWVDNILVMENVKGFQCVHKINTRMSILKKNIGTKSDEAEKTLKEMANDCGIKLGEDFEIEDVKWCSNNKPKASITTSNEPETLESDDDFFESASDTSFVTGGSDTEVHKRYDATKPIVTKPKINQEWDKLCDESYFKVNIGAFQNPHEFYVYRMDSTDVINKINELEYLILKFLEDNQVPVYDFEIGKDCLAEFDGTYIRAKIKDLEIANDGTILQVFFCDIGVTSKFYTKDVFETSNEIISFMPYQAIQCKLIGIKPKKLNWDESLSNEIYDTVIDTIDSNSYWQIYTVRSSEPIQNDLGLNSYEVLLFTDEYQINSQILKLNYAIPDKDTNHFLELGNLLEGDEDIEFDLEMGIEDMTNSLGIPKEILDKAVSDAKQKMLKNEPTITEMNDNSEISNIETKEEPKMLPKIKREKILAEKLYRPAVVPPAPEKFRLKTIPSPKTTWYQTRHSINLIIVAPDLDDYELKVTDSMVLFAYMFDGELKLHELHLLASIVSEKTTTKIRGVNFHMTLLKAVPIMWPRLTFSNDKFSWLNYHYDKFEDNYIEYSKKKLIQDIEKAVNDDNFEDDDEGREDVYYRGETRGDFKKIHYNNEEKLFDDYDHLDDDPFDPLDDGF